MPLNDGLPERAMSHGLHSGRKEAILPYASPGSEFSEAVRTPFL